MGKQKKWHVFLIFAVIALTVYNILPTVFYYARPLKQQIQQPQAAQTAEAIAARLSALESGSLSWAKSYCDLLSIKPLEIAFDPDLPGQIRIECSKTEDAARLRAMLPREPAR